MPVQFESDIRRVIARQFDPGGVDRIRNVLDRVAQLSNAEVDHVLGEVLGNFRNRHQDIEAVFEEHYAAAMEYLEEPDHLPRNRRLLVGSYLTSEYSIESAALFNPSIVPHWNQRNVPAGGVRFILSLRATGEGHVSSIVFRTGVIHDDHTIRMDPPRQFLHPARCSPDNQYEKRLFCRKLRDIGVRDQPAEQVLEGLGEHFTFLELERAIAARRQTESDQFELEETIQGILWLAQSNYELVLPRGADASEVVIFPQTINESHGIEDLRMVRFVDDDGSVTYFGTCSAFDGYRVMPQLIETVDFQRLRIHTLNGAGARNKGLALFPRRIDGHYVMCSRIDGENLYLMYSDMVYFWETAELLQTPRRPWELVQIGNCGSPLETPAGWLLLTHGVGPMRTYCIGAMLLDLDDPHKVIGCLDEPLIVPTEEDRDGYVPNVVYTCGTLLHNGYLYIPFATSDRTSRFAFLELDRLLERLVD
ncbi:MAG: glycoside hydrolase family 130 protein [Pirellulales bacterium]